MSSTSPTTVMMGIFSILFGLVSAYGVREMMTKEEPAPIAPVKVEAPAPEAPVPMHTIVLAKKNIAPNTCLTKDMLNVIRIPQKDFEHIQNEAGKTDAFPFESLERALNRVTNARILAGNWITEECLYEFGNVPTLEDKLNDGELAMSIPVDEMASVAGFLHPDAMINISWMPKESIHPDLPAAVAMCIYKNVRVLATSAEMFEYNPGNPREIENITIAVDQKMANTLTVLQSKGTFSIALAGTEDSEASEAGTAEERETIFSALGLEAPEEIMEGSASTDAWKGTSKQTNDFNTKEVLESINATRVVMNDLKPLKKLPKKSVDPDTVEIE